MRYTDRCLAARYIRAHALTRGCFIHYTIFDSMLSRQTRKPVLSTSTRSEFCSESDTKITWVKSAKALTFLSPLSFLFCFFLSYFLVSRPILRLNTWRKEQPLAPFEPAKVSFTWSKCEAQLHDDIFMRYRKYQIAYKELLKPFQWV